jgi:WSC domain
MQYIEKIKNKYNKYEGFQQRKIETPVYDASQKVYGSSNTQSNPQLLQSQNDSLTNYSTAFDKDIGRTQDYVNRISSSNPYLNKFVHFTNGTIAYVTNLGVAKPIGAWETYQSLLGKNGCPADAVSVSIDWLPSYIEGSIIPLNPTLVVGSQMTAGESCGNEGSNVYVSSLVSKDATAAYQGCYQDSSPSIMTFIGDMPPVQIDVSIVNGDFSQPVLANNTVKYTTNDINFSKIPGWEFGAILNNGDGWTTLPKPFPFGAQCALLQYVGYITQSVNFSVGTYNLEFASTGRQTSWNTESNSISIIIDKDTKNSSTISTFQPPLGKWEMYSIPLTISTPGMHTITFQGQGNAKDTSGGYDVSSALQGIRLAASGTASGAGNYTYDQCKTAAIDGGYTYFGLQYGNPTTGKGYCAVTNDSVGATKNGTSYAISGAVPLWSSNTSTGAGNTASVSIQGSLSVLNSQGAAIFSTPGSSDSAPSSYIGCYGDTGNRALPNLLGNDGSITLDTCKKAAAAKGYAYFGLQDFVNPSYLECWAGSDLQQAKKYGLATNCTKLSDGTMVGGGWSNTVYTTGNPPSDYFLILQDDGNLCLYKGTGPSDNQGGIWYSMTNGKQQKPNPAFAASKGKFGKNYMKTGDTLATGDFVGSNDGSIYLIMQSDGNLVLYTSQSAENCLKSADGSSSIGGQGATALYKMSEIGIPGNLGKIGYVDKNSEIYMYPDNKIGLSNNYMKYPDNVSYGNDIPGALNSGGSLDQCKSTCNSLSECYGFEYHSSGNVCYPKDKNMYPVGAKQSMPNNGMDLYVREKMIKEGFETAEIDTNKWKNYANNNKMFNDSIVDSASKQISDADKKELLDLNNKVTSFSQEIQRNNAEYKQNLSNVNTRTVDSTAYMKDSHVEYNKLQSKIKDSAIHLLNMENIAADTNILAVQQNAHYAMYAIIALILLIITIKFLS